MFNANSEHYNTATNVHKASFWISVIMACLGVILLGLGLSFVATYNALATDDYWSAIYIFLILVVNCVLAVAITTIITQIFALSGYGLMNKGLVIAYIVLTSLSVVVDVVCIAVPAVYSTVLTTVCEAWRASNDSYENDPEYHAACEVAAPRFTTIVAFIAILTVLSFIQAILGCVGASAIGKKEIVQSTYAHPVVATQPTVVVATGQPAQAYPAQVQAYPAQGYPPQQGGYPPQGYPPQGYPPQQGGYPPQQAYYPPPTGAETPYPPPPTTPGSQ